MRMSNVSLWIYEKKNWYQISESEKFNNHYFQSFIYLINYLLQNRFKYFNLLNIYSYVKKTVASIACSERVPCDENFEKSEKNI